MVGNSFNRSPSPMSGRANPNPNSRSNNQETEGFGVRKGFNGYPFAKSSLISQQKTLIPNTPVNSPAEYASRSSFRDHEQKENERDTNIKPVAARAKSPCIISKGTKNFMSPTISASSKINPSPRKKVLGERNEAIRTSASLSDGKFHFFSTSSLDFDNKIESNSDMGHPPCSTPVSYDKAEDEVQVHYSKPEKHEFQQQNGFGSSLGEVKIEAFEPDLVVISPEVPLNTAKSSESLPLSKKPKTIADHNVGLDIKKATYSSPCIIAPLDAEPSLPPYDPKNNYLSPRPPFLHYNPNRRKLEDEFTCESVSETENSSEVQSGDSLNVEEDVASSGISSEINLTESQQIEEMVEAKIEPLSRKFTSWKTVAVLLLFLLGFMSIFLTFYPGIGNAMFRDEAISHIYSDSHAVAVLAKENLNLVIQNAKLWSAYSVDYFSQIIQSVRGVDRFSSLEFVNLTAWQEQEDWSCVVKEFPLEPYFEKIEDDQAFTEMQGYYEPEDQAFTQMQIYIEQKDDDFSAQEAEMEEDSGSEGEEVSVIDVETFTQVQSLQTPEDDQTSVGEAELVRVDNSEPEEVEENSAVEKASSVDELNTVEVEYKVGIDLQSDVKVEVEDQFILSPEIQPQEADTMKTKMTEPLHVPEIEPQIRTANELPEKDDNVETGMTELVSDSFLLEATEGNSQLQEASEKILAPIAVAVALLVMSLFAYFMYMKPKKDTLLADPVMPEKKNYTYAASNMENSLLRETPSSWSGQVEVDMTGNPCPSEMSSFQNSTSIETRQRDGDEAHSPRRSSKRNYKRESLASSSSEYTMDSAYGSFTTYSIIHPKHGDDEVVTPVRRSSRIRSKVTSP